MLATLNHPSVPLFEYWDESPHEWKNLLERSRESGQSEVQVPVLWGIHEGVRGIRDFSKQSKLRLERLLSLAQSAGVDLEVVIGFPSHPQAFPAWTWEVPEKETILRKVWEEDAPYFSFLELPSPRQREIKEGFHSFLNELSLILSLYKAPEGPVKRIRFSLLPIEFSQSLTQDPMFLRHLEERYPVIEQFNQKFQTSYRDLRSVTTAVGVRYVEAKRPWVYAYDYQWNRRRFCEAFVEELRSLESIQSLNDIILWGENTLPKQQERQSLLFFDSISVQPRGDGSVFPLCPESLTTASALSSFQFLSWMKERATADGFTVLPLPAFGDLPNEQISNAMIVCGKYLTKISFNFLKAQFQGGAKLYFPFSMPQYDENLGAHDLLQGGTRSLLKLENKEYTYIRKNNGGLLFSSENLENPSNENWDDLKKLHELFLDWSKNG